MTDTPAASARWSHGGGCGCKLDPAVLRRLLADMPAAGPFERLLVATRPRTDAAVWALDDGTCVIATTDFFNADGGRSRDFGRIAATNAISDVLRDGRQAHPGARHPGMPVGRIARRSSPRSLRGGASICAEAGIPVAGGHSIDTPEPIYGLAVIGTCRREEVRRNADARAGDALILTKPIGVGIYSAAIKREILPDGGYADFIRHDDAPQRGRNGARPGPGRARDHRRDRLRRARPRPRTRPGAGLTLASRRTPCRCCPRPRRSPGRGL